MAYKDTEAFLRERGVLFDPSLDINPGSSFDINLVQPMLRRLGTDPFTVDVTTFVNDRMAQAYPDAATKEGDTLTDLLNKPVTLLFDPLVRENTRVVRNLSFKDSAALTLDEADALGANYYSNRRTGDYARGVSRIYFNSPQDVTISQVNYLTTRRGLHFFPRTIQSIRAEEMILNYDQEYSLYFFDINAIAEKPGTGYNIEPGEMFSIANVAAAVRVDNTRRFQFGDSEETAEEFIYRIQQELSERSMVTLRGIASKLLENFPEVSRLNVVGMNDPEMMRDILEGGGLGVIVAHGIAGAVVHDGEGQDFSRRFYTAEADFTALITSAATSWVLTVFEAFGSSVIKARDMDVSGVHSTNELDLDEQLMVPGSVDCRWTLRKKELTLSAIPGGILFPDTANGTISIPDGVVHVGGAYDVHVRGSSFDEATLVIESVTDDEPLLSGFELTVESGSPNYVVLNSLMLGEDYDDGDATYEVFQSAEIFGYTLQILEGVDAGNYRILSVTQQDGHCVELVLTPAPTNPGATQYRWKLFDEINIDLVEPKETRIEGNDLRTLQGSDVVDTGSGTNFNEYGVAEGDTLRLLTGNDAGDYTLVAAPLSPSYEKLQLDRPLSRSASSLQFVIFRPNGSGGILRPLVRLTSVELLDSSSQPLGSTIPYAKPVDIQSRAFQNPARGVKHDLRHTRLGLMTVEATWTGAAYQFMGVTAGQTLLFWEKDGNWGSVTITNTNPYPFQLANDFNAGYVDDHPQGAFVLGESRVAFRPKRGGLFVGGGTAMAALFGGTDLQSTFDIRDDSVTDWSDLDPEVELESGLDVVQVLDGFNVGFYEAPYLVNFPIPTGWGGGTATPSEALMAGGEYDEASEMFSGSGFAPQVNRRVQIGARSLGSARIFFLEPTSFEVDDNSRFKLETDTGDLYFLPDPTLTYERVPAPPAGVQPVDGTATPNVGDIWTSTSQDFILSAIRLGDILQVRTRPIAGTVVLSNPIDSLVYRTLVFSLDGGPDRTLTFIRDDASLADHQVSRNGVVDQINSAAGEEICQLTVTNTLEFHTTRDLIIRSTGTANMPDLGDSPPFLGLLDELADTGGAGDFSTDQNNISPMAGDYDIIAVGQTTLQVSTTFPAASPFTLNPLTRQSYKVLRKGVQRIVATAMADNEAEAGLYYFDVELLSEGTGDAWNIDADQQMTVEGYRSDGYYLTTDDENLSFSDAEAVKLILSRSILEVGVNDDPANATQLSSQNVQLTYERSGLVGDVQNFTLSETERVVCSSPLSRHLTPHFVRFDMVYVGGSDESVVVPEMETYIRKVYPQSALESSDLQKILHSRGADSITNPIDLIAIVHYPDRTVYATRSQDALTTGRLAAFIPDVLNVTKRVA